MAETRPLKPWPADAVVIVAALAGEENPATMRGEVFPAACRDCGAVLHADGHTHRVARHLPSRHGRPIVFLCIACTLTYDRGDITELHDHAGVTRPGWRSRHGD